MANILLSTVEGGGLSIPVGGTVQMAEGAPFDFTFNGARFLASGLVETDTTKFDTNVFSLHTMLSSTPFQITVGSFSGNNISSIAHNGSMFVATAGSEVASSPDGTTWTIRTMPNGSQNATVVFTNGLFFVLGSGGGLGRLYSSPDGINWTERNAGNFVGSVILSGIAWNGTRYVVTCWGSTSYWHSTNLTSWTSGTLPNSALSISSNIVSGNGIFVVAQSNSVMTSSDGLNWVAVNTTMTANITSMAFGNGSFLVVSSTPTQAFTSTTAASGSWASVVIHPSTGTIASSGNPRVSFASSVFYIVTDRVYRLGTNLILEEMRGSANAGASQQSMCAVSASEVRLGQSTGFTNRLVFGRYAGARLQTIASGLRQYVRIS